MLLKLPLHFVRHRAVSKILTLGIRFTMWRMERILEPVVADRIRLMKDFGEKWNDKPVSGYPPDALSISAHRQENVHVE